MNLIFLQNAILDPRLISTGLSSSLGNIAGAFVGIFIVFMLIGLAFYIYLSAAYSSIGKKAGLTNPGIAWMPYGGLLAVIFEASKMHWWPFLISTLGIFLAYILMLSTVVIGVFGTILGILFLALTFIILTVMIIMWHWKTYEAVGKPGWWALIPILATIIGYALVFIGVLGISLAMSILGIILAILGVLIHLIFVGIAAWSKT